MLKMPKDFGRCFVSAYTESLAEAKNLLEPAIEGVDMFFSYHKKALALDGSEIDTPSLKGTSGTAVWALSDQVPGVWTPEKAIKMIGIQSAFSHSQYFRAKSISAVAYALKEMDHSLVLQLESALGSEIN